VHRYPLNSNLFQQDGEKFWPVGDDADIRAIALIPGATMRNAV
jgi:hypothetical protein